MFDSDYFILKTEQMQVLGSGKSGPLLVQYVLQNRDNKEYRRARVIVKEVKPDPKTFRMESNVANFFSESGLVDKDTTYRIFHLSRGLAVI